MLLHCGKAYRLWSLLFSSFGISWVLPRSIADTLFHCWNWPGKHSSSIWNLALLCLMWCLWWKRNWRTWKVPMISYWLLSVAPFFIGLELGDSPLVILSLCSLDSFFVISIFFFLFFYHLFLYFLPLPYDFSMR